MLDLGQAKTPPHFRVTGFSTLGETTCSNFYADADAAGIFGAAPIGPPFDP